MTNLETLCREHPRDASDAVMALSMLSRYHYEDRNTNTRRLYGKLSDAVPSAVVSQGRGRARPCGRFLNQRTW